MEFDRNIIFILIRYIKIFRYKIYNLIRDEYWYITRVWIGFRLRVNTRQRSSKKRAWRYITNDRLDLEIRGKPWRRQSSTNREKKRCHHEVWNVAMRQQHASQTPPRGQVSIPLITQRSQVHRREQADTNETRVVYITFDIAWIGQPNLSLQVLNVRRWTRSVWLECKGEWKPLW